MNNNRIILVLILCSLWGWTNAQEIADKKRTPVARYLYRITNAQAKAYLMNGNDAIDSTFFTKQLETNVTSSYFNVKKYGAGHYISLDFHASEMRVAYEAITLFYVSAYDGVPYPVIEVYDAEGKAIAGASVVVSDTVLSYDPISKTYFNTKMKPKNSFLEVAYDGFTGYYDYAANIYKKFKKPKKQPKKKKKHVEKAQPRLRGYIATNKPIYMPKDTIKFKAYITLPDGQPYNDSVSILLRVKKFDIWGDEDGGEPWGEAMRLSPTSEGAFVGEFIVHDSLTLGLDYDLGVRATGYQPISNSFYLDDYELKGVTEFTLAATKSEFNDEPITLVVTAKDANGLPVYGTRAKLSVKYSSAADYYLDSLFIPYTFLDTMLVFEESEEIIITLEKEQIPKAEMRFSANCEFTTPDNEKKSAYQSFAYFEDSWEQEEQQLTANITNGKLTVNFARDTPEGDVDSAVVTLKDVHSNELWKEVVALPYERPIEPAAYMYDITVKKAFASRSVYVKGSHSRLKVEATQGDKSIFLGVTNPMKLRFNLSVYALTSKGVKQVTNVWSEQDKFKTEVKAKPNVAYYYAVQYSFAGMTQQIMSEVFQIKEKLNLEVKQRSKVFPGQVDTIQVNVKDYNNLPVPKVNLTAFSVNSVFENDNTPRFSISAKTHGTLPDYPKHIENFYDEYGTEWFIGREWYEMMQLDSFTYYRLMYPKAEDNGKMEMSFPTDSAYAEVSPYVVHKGYAQPIHLIYANDRLIYYSGADNNEAYSFLLKPGTYTFRLRTADREFNVPLMKVKKGNHLIFTIDAALYQNQNNDSLPPVFTEREVENLYNSCLIMGHYNDFNYQIRRRYDSYMYTSKFLVQGNRRFRARPEQRNYYGEGYSRCNVFGPFQSYEPIEIVEPNKFHKSFKFIPHASYYIDEQGIHTYYVDSVHRYYDTLSAETFIPKFAQKALKDHEIVLTNKQLPVKSDGVHYNYRRCESGNTSLRMDINLDIEARLATLYRYSASDTITCKKVQSLNGSEISFGQLSAGYHGLIVQTKTGGYVKYDSIQLLADGVNYRLLYEKEVFAPDSLSRWAKNGLLLGVPPASLQAITTDSAFTHPVEEKVDNQLSYDEYQGEGYWVEGVMRSKESGKPLMGSVSVIGIHQRTSADNQGRYIIFVPKGYDSLRFGKYGYEDIDTVTVRSRMNVMLSKKKLGNNKVDRVVSTGMASTPQPLRAAAVMESSDDSWGGEDEEGFAEAEEEEISFLIIESEDYSEEDMAFGGGDDWGDDGGFGDDEPAAKSTAKKPKADSKEVDQLAKSGNQSVRSNFRDYGYWQPNTLTDAAGRANIPIQYPDDIAAWNTKLIAYGQHHQRQIATSVVNSYKPVVASLKTPRFLVQGDTATLIGRVSNYTGVAYPAETNYVVKGDTLDPLAETLKNSVLRKETITAQEEDTVSATFSVTLENGYFDGERRDIPVYRKGVEEADGFFALVEQDTALHYSFDAAAPVEVYITENLLDVLMQEIEIVQAYEYDCMEQTASKLIANLMAKRIMEARGEAFGADTTIHKLIGKLDKGQNNQGAWGWWRFGRTHYWMSAHVYKALMMAKKAGYEIPSVENYLGSLRFNLDKLRGYDLVDAIDVLVKADEIEDPLKYIEAAEEYFKEYEYRSAYQQMKLISIRQSAGYDYDLDSLWKYEKQDIFGGLYFGEENTYWYDNSTAVTLLAYDILKKDGPFEEEMKLIRQYLLGIKQRYGQWRSTRESAEILYTIIEEIMEETDGKPSELNFSWKGSGGKAVSKLPFEQQVAASAFPLAVEGNGATYISCTQKKWNAEPERNNSSFIVNTVFVANGDTITELTGGEEVTLVVEVEAKAKAEFVMIEVPIPAGCSYGEKRMPTIYRSWWGPEDETHREYYRNKTSIFAEKVSKGKHIYRINLVPRYSGSYTLNPAKAELMYFPTFFGRDDMKKVKVE